MPTVTTESPVVLCELRTTDERWTRQLMIDFPYFSKHFTLDWTSLETKQSHEWDILNSSDESKNSNVTWLVLILYL